MSPTVGILSSTESTNVYVAAFQARLAALGWIDKDNLVVSARWANGVLTNLPSLAMSLLSDNPDVIMAGSTPAIRAALDAVAALNRPIPIVMGITGDPRVAGDVLNINQPKGNVTGMWDHNNLQNQNQMEILHDVVGGNNLKVGLLFNRDNRGKRPEVRALENVKIRRVTINVKRYGVSSDMATVATEIHDAYTDAKGPATRQAMIVLGDPILGHSTVAPVIRTEGLTLKTMYGASEAAENGGLMSYGPSHKKVMERAADYVDMILRGADPGELPIAQPMDSHMELVVNTTTYAAIGGQTWLTAQFEQDWHPRKVT